MGGKTECNILTHIEVRTTILTLFDRAMRLIRATLLRLIIVLIRVVLFFVEFILVFLAVAPFHEESPAPASQSLDVLFDLAEGISCF